METLIVQSKDKATSKLLQQLLKELKGIKKVSVLSEDNKEDIALAVAIEKGKTGRYVDATEFISKLKQK